MSENYQLQIRNYSISEQENVQSQVQEEYQLAQYNMNDNPVVAVITIQINENESENLEIRYNDQPGELAKQFCEKMNLDPQIIPMLENNILQDKEIAIQELYEKEVQQEQQGQVQVQSSVRTGLENSENNINNTIAASNSIQLIQNSQRSQNEQLVDSQQKEEEDNKIDDHYIPVINRIKHNESIQSNQSKSQINNKQNNQLNQIMSQIKMQFPPPSHLISKQPIKENQLTSNIAWVPERKSFTNVSENASIFVQDQPLISGQSRGRGDSFANYSIANSQIQEYPVNNIKQQFLNNLNNNIINPLHNNSSQQSSIYLHSSTNKKGYKKEMYRNRSQSLMNKSNSDCSFIQNRECTFTPMINPLSEQIVKQKMKHFERSSTHERLYEMGLKKKLQKDESIEKLSSKNGRKSFNQSLNQQISASEKERKELEECTYKPQLNEISQKLTMQKRIDPNRKIEDELLIQNKFSESKKNKAKAKALENELKGCTFQPRINELSEYLCNQKKDKKDLKGNSEKSDKINSINQQQKYEFLYEQAKQKQFQKSLVVPPQAIDRNCTFKPDINKTSSQSIHTSFNERLQQQRVLKQEKEIKQLREKFSEFKDKQTGQTFFRPQTGRNPLTQRNIENLNVNEYLYQRSKQESSRKERELAEKLKEKHQLQINDNSKKIVQQIEDNRIREIFDLLDNDKDGQINAQSINITNVSPQILELISPVLYEMEDYNFQLNYEEFSQAIKRLVKGFTSQQKHDLFIYSKRQRDSMHKNSDQNFFEDQRRINNRSTANLKY